MGNIIVNIILLVTTVTVVAAGLYDGISQKRQDERRKRRIRRAFDDIERRNSWNRKD